MVQGLGQFNVGICEVDGFSKRMELAWEGSVINGDSLLSLLNDRKYNIFCFSRGGTGDMSKPENITQFVALHFHASPLQFTEALNNFPISVLCHQPENKLASPRTHKKYALFVKNLSLKLH